MNCTEQLATYRDAVIIAVAALVGVLLYLGYDDATHQVVRDDTDDNNAN